MSRGLIEFARRGKALIRSHILIGAIAALPLLNAEFEPEAFYIDYRDAVPLDIITSHARAIVHPESDLDAMAARVAGTSVYAYLSVGEIGANAPHRDEVLALDLPFRGTNTIWNSDLVDFRDERWETFFVDNLARGIVEQGYTGFFLDTLDSINLDASIEETEVQRAGLLSMLRRLHATYPDHEIVTNRGFRTVPLIYDQLSGLLVESVYRGYDFENNAFVEISSSETATLEDHMNAARDAGLEVFVLDYVDPDQPTLAAETAQRILTAGYHAFITTPPLTGATLGPWLPEEPSLREALANMLVRPGQRVYIQALVQGAPFPEIVWFKNDEIIPDENAATLSFPSALESDGGVYRVRLANRFGTFESGSIIVSVDPNARPSRLTNLSARVWTGGNQSPVIPGVVAAGEVSILARAIGPGLSSVGVDRALADPDLSVVRSAQPTLFNDDWSVSPSADQLAATAARVGAFPLAGGSLDAALQFELQGTATLPLGQGSGSGNALVELYLVPDDAKTGRLANLSLRTEVDGSSGALIVGFVLEGDVAEQVLIRAIGPGLTVYGVDDPMADPALSLYRGDLLTAENRNWTGGTPSAEELNDAFATYGAFPFVPESNDAALLLDLEPGVYTAHVRDATGGDGTVLVEVYIRLSNE